MGLSAYSSEKRAVSTQSGDGIGTNEGPEVKDTVYLEGTPSSPNGTNIDIIANSTATSSDGTEITNQPKATDSMGNNESDNHT